MQDFKLFKEIGIGFPKGFQFTKNDWKDFYTTLSKFKQRTLRRHGINPKSISPTGETIPYKRGG